MGVLTPSTLGNLVLTGVIRLKEAMREGRSCVSAWGLVEEEQSGHTQEKVTWRRAEAGATRPRVQGRPTALTAAGGWAGCPEQICLLPPEATSPVLTVTSDGQPPGRGQSAFLPLEPPQCVAISSCGHRTGPRPLDPAAVRKGVHPHPPGPFSSLG